MGQKPLILDLRGMDGIRILVLISSPPPSKLKTLSGGEFGWGGTSVKR